MSQTISRRAIAAALVIAASVATAAVGELVSAQEGGTYYFDMTIPFDAGATWAIGDIWHFPWYEEVTPESPLEGADARLIFRDEAGGVVLSRLVERMWCCNGECEEADFAIASVPAQPAARRAQLYTIDATGLPVDLRAERVRSANVPVVEILSPKPGQVLTDGMLIEWRGYDGDGDDLLFNVLYRPSVGPQRQAPLAVMTDQTSFVFRRNDKPSDENATIAIQANDGFNTTENTATRLQVRGNLPPKVEVYSPRHLDVYGWGSNVILSAYAVDPEDGNLPVVWTSDLDGVVHGLNWSTGSRGIHRLAASATDSEGMTGSERMTIFIGVEPPPQLFLPLAATTGTRGGWLSGIGLRSLTPENK